MQFPPKHNKIYVKHRAVLAYNLLFAETNLCGIAYQAQGASRCWMPCRSNSILSVMGLGYVAWKNVGYRQERSTFSFCPVLWHFWTAGARHICFKPPTSNDCS